MRGNGTNDSRQTIQAAERRQWGRYTMPATEVLITLTDEVRRGVLVDESIGGIGVELDDVTHMAADDQLELVYCDVTVQGTIKSIRQMDSGNYHVGISWQNGQSQPTSHGRSNCSAQYVASNGLALVCQPLGPRPDGMIAVRLWDGARFDVPLEQLSSSTVEQRRQQLESLDSELNVLDGLYHLGQHGSASDLIEAILDFEFGSDKPVG
jgi:hypothetical protein